LYILDGLEIAVEEAKQAADSIRSPALQPIASVFARNVDELLNLLSLPLALVLVGRFEVNRLADYTRAIARTEGAERWQESEEVKARVEAEVNRLRDERAAKAQSRSPELVEAKQQLEHLLGDHGLEGSARALLYAGASSAWSFLECAVKDAWIAALNVRPVELAHSALENVPDIPVVDGLSGKQVSVGLLARHGFDLRDKLGTLLAPKFDFTSPSGIRAACSAAFGKLPGLDDALADPRLRRLEATRHLVVHRAGVIDEEYLRRTGDGAAIGSQLVVDGPAVSELANAAISAGSKVLRLVDAWLVEHPPRVQDQGGEA